MIRTFIALGSNLQEPNEQVDRAVSAIAKLPKSSIYAQSPWYQSSAVGPGDQPDYINGVIALGTELNAAELLIALQGIEKEQHRIRTTRWGPRTLDLDILLYGNNLINEPKLTIPHPRMRERNFVLFPLYDIAPDLVLPGGDTLHKLIAASTKKGLCLVNSLSSNTMQKTERDA